MVNYLSKFYLVNRLIEDGHLERSNGIPRIIFVSSESHRNPEGFDWDGFGQYREYKMKEVIGRYGYFKLLMTTFARELARRHSSSSALPLEVRALCPGPVNSSIAREAPAAFQPLLKLVFSIFFKSPQDACEPVVYFAAGQQEDLVSFDYLYLMSKRSIDPMAEDEDNGRRLWSVSESLIRDTHIHV